MSKTVGILGGMGPAATVDLFQKIVQHTPAAADQEHVKILIYNNPQIPPRSLEANSPLPELIRSATLLEQAGADFLVMPCHTAHLWYEGIKKSITIPFYSMIENTAQALIEKYPQQVEILLLATSTTLHSGLYQKALSRTVVKLIPPTLEQQKVVDQAIKHVKAGRLPNKPLQDLQRFLVDYQREGVSAVLGCCTEIPLMFPYFQVDMDLLDPTLMLALLAIHKAM